MGAHLQSIAEIEPDGNARCGLFFKAIYARLGKMILSGRQYRFVISFGEVLHTSKGREHTVFIAQHP